MEENICKNEMHENKLIGQSQETSQVIGKIDYVIAFLTDSLERSADNMNLIDAIVKLTEAKSNLITTGKIFLSTGEAAERLGMCPEKVRELCRSNYKGFPGVLDGNKFRVNSNMLQQWADEYTKEMIQSMQSDI